MTTSSRVRLSTVEDVAREFARECDLQGQLVLSVFVARLKLRAAEQAPQLKLVTREN